LVDARFDRLTMLVGISDETGSAVVHPAQTGLPGYKFTTDSINEEHLT